MTPTDEIDKGFYKGHRLAPNADRKQPITKKTFGEVYIQKQTNMTDKTIKTTMVTNERFCFENCNLLAVNTCVG